MLTRKEQRSLLSMALEEGIESPTLTVGGKHLRLRGMYRGRRVAFTVPMSPRLPSLTLIYKRCDVRRELRRIDADVE